jgi:carbon monoxide dehydrogenase subunit G
MTKLQLVLEVHAPVRTVWTILNDPTYLSKLYTDVISVEVDPPGHNFVGQKVHIIGKAGRRRLEVFSETTELVPEKKIVSRNRPGGLFKSFEAIVLLEPSGANTEVKTSFDYELSMGYLGRVFNMVMMERLVMDNLKSYSKNLKEICELMPIPE